MADRKVLTPIHVKSINKDTHHNDTAWVSAGTGVEIIATQDHSCALILLLKSTEASTVTIKGGTGVFAGEDKILGVNTDVTTVICPDIGRHKIMHGADKGKIILQAGSDKVSVIAYLLPFK